jgi:hypothetical protein
MWVKIKNPVYLIILSIIWVVVDLILETFFNMTLVFGSFHVIWVAPILFIIGIIWLIITLVKK